MNIKLIDFIRLIDTCKSYSELKIKCDLIYGMDFIKIFDKFSNYMGYQVPLEFLLATPDNRNLAKWLMYIAEKFEEKHKTYIQKSINYESKSYTRYIDEYILPDNYKKENISINI